MKEKIILISMSPYEDSIVNNHYFKKDFEKKGHIFEYWSISELVGFNYSKDEFPFTRYFKSVKEIVDALNAEEEKFICNIQLALIPKLYPIFKAVERNASKIYEIKYLEGSISVMNDDSSNKWKETKKLFNLRMLIKRIMQKNLLKKYEHSRINQRLIVFLPPGMSNNSKLEVHHFDYEINKTIKNVFSKENYFLFIDQALPTHPDVQLAGLKNIDKEIYLRKMNHFFDFIESKFNINVIIAAHPKASYKQSDFKHRKVIKYKTAELSKYAEVIFTHYSTSFNYAVLNNKPIVLLTMDDFFIKNNTGLYNKMKVTQNISKTLNAPIINIDKDLDKLNDDIFTVDSEKYETFKNNYLISKANKHLSNFEIVYNYLFPKK